MGAKWFKCPDGEQIEIARCLANGGCRMVSRCATRPYLRLVSHEREWRGVSPSAAGNGPRLIYLRQVTDFVTDPDAAAFAAVGTATHAKLSLHYYTRNVLSEEPLSDELMRGIPDVLEEDEDDPKSFVLTDYKTWGSYKVMKGLGIVQTEEKITDEAGNQLFFKTGKSAGQPKTRKVYARTGEPDLTSEELQLNMYRIFFEKNGFPVSKMNVQAIVRDGATFVAEGRGIDRRVYVLPIKRLDDRDVIGFYNVLRAEVGTAFKHGWVRRCNAWENWEGRRCQEYCEVKNQCQQMDQTQQ